jgi:hypothetical protein
MSNPEAYRNLAAQQAELVAALSGAGPPAAGFDPERLEASAASLLTKRIRSAARAWPVLADSLGAEFDGKFRTFAAANPLPRDGSPFVDGFHFARDLSARGELPDEARLELLAMELSHVPSSGGLRPRRGPAFRVARMGRPARLVLACRLPLVGVRWLVVPLGLR